MKVYITLFVLAAVASYAIAAHTPAQIAQIRQQCIQDLKVPTEYVEQIKQFKYPDEEVVRCYIRCTSLKTGLWTDESGFIVDKVVEQLGVGQDQANFKAEVEKCIDNNSQKSDNCTWAYRNFQCFIAKHLIAVKSQIEH